MNLTGYKKLWSHPATVVVLAVALLGLDFVSGPSIRFPIVYVVAVALAAWRHGCGFGCVLAVGMPLVRLWFVHSLWQESEEKTAIEWINACIQWGVLLGTAWLVGRSGAQQRALQEDLRVLQGLLSVCYCCKRVRDNSGVWLPKGTAIPPHLEATVSSTICPDCLEDHYRDVLGRQA